MLDPETKRRIDNCRDILVGKVPDPKSQVEQITIALIYKFMDDMDARSENAGGKRAYFSGGYARYGWTKLMTPGMGGQEMLNLYAEVIQKMSENSKLPELFRNIFKDAYLPYRDPETLRAFLKEIDGFTYDHSERLGDAFEYLLSVLGSQGDAGQFRTPRHIIDFMVEIIDPKTGEKILDPACGTAGFLISSYKHIWARNMKNGRTTLTPKKRKDLAENITGYDISPDMVRLSLVNMYLHGFAQPDIHEYDTLTSEDRWGDYAHVILANPPFMSPKGGIRPHQRFSVQANRSEVLFVDYIAEHLLPTGRAGVIVPEGVIFQSGTAYKQLRKMLVEGFLAAVISLPAGVFNPYSGVKTSILILDKQLAKRTDSILFAKIEHDGFNLGAQRRRVDEDDLPKAAEYIKGWLSAVRTGKTFEAEGMANVHLVKKQEIAESGEFNLSGERYRKVEARKSQKWPMVELGEVSVVDWGNTKLTKKSYIKDGKYLGVSATGCDGRIEYFEHEVGVIVLSAIGANCGRVFYPVENFVAIKNTITFTPDHSKIEPKFLFYVMENNTLPRRGAGQPFMTKGDVKQYKILLPSLDVQREMVAEIEGYQKIIDAARQIISAHRPHMPLNPDWPMIKIGEIFTTSSGGTPLKSNAQYYENGSIPWLKSGEVAQGHIYRSEEFITEDGLKNSSAKVFPINTVLVAMYGATAGYVGLLKFKAATNQAICGIFPNEKIVSEFLYYFLREKRDYFVKLSSGGAQPNISQTIIKNLEIPLPPLEVQKKIVAGIEKEQKFTDVIKELIKLYEEKIKTTLNRLWNEA